MTRARERGSFVRAGAAAAVGALGALLTFGAAACSGPAVGHEVPSALPDPATFGPVAALLDARCGSLDCHGRAGRNLRLYGSAGLRLSASDRPLVPPCNTSDEVTQDYASVVGLEPERLGGVVAGGDPAALTLVRKARGAEAHKGGSVWAPGDAADVCLTGWLQGSPRASSCAEGLTAVLSGGAVNPLVACVSAP